MEKTDTTALLKQIEYYMSDKNLQSDLFFYDKLNKEGKIELNLFLNCNGVKKLNANLSDITSVLMNSEHLIMEDNFVKRKVPQLPNFLGKKRDKEVVEKKVEEKKTDSNNTLNFNLEFKDPIILYISSDKDQPVKWKDMLRKLQLNLPKYEIVYSRFSHQKGQAALFPREESTDLDLNEESFNIKFDLEGINFTVRVPTEHELQEFWKDHGSHYEFCISEKMDQQKNTKRDRQPKVNKNLLKAQVVLGGEIYFEVGKIKAKAREIFYSSNEKYYEVVDTKDKAFLLDLFIFVDETIDSSKDYKVTVERLSDHTYSKSFCVYKGEKREIVSYLNAVVKLSVANRKLKGTVEIKK